VSPLQREEKPTSWSRLRSRGASRNFWRGRRAVCCGWEEKATEPGLKSPGFLNSCRGVRNAETRSVHWRSLSNRETMVSLEIDNILVAEPVSAATATTTERRPLCSATRISFRAKDRKMHWVGHSGHQQRDKLMRAETKRGGARPKRGRTNGGMQVQAQYGQDKLGTDIRCHGCETADHNEPGRERRRLRLTNRHDRARNNERRWRQTRRFGRPEVETTEKGMLPVGAVMSKKRRVDNNPDQ